MSDMTISLPNNVFIYFYMMTIMESWLDKTGRGLVLLSGPGSDPEVSLESGERGALLGGWSDELGALEQGDCHVAISCRTVTSRTVTSCHAVVSYHSTASASRCSSALITTSDLPIYG